MGDVLSQSEIDNLLNALSSGELDVDEIKENSEQTVKDYDFARPSKFSKEHLRTLEIIFEHYGRLLTTNPSRLSAKVSAGRGDEFGGSYILRIHKCAFKSGAAWYCQLCTVTGEYNS